MKKINLKNLSFDEVLTKEELTKIVGGNGSGCQDFVCTCFRWVDDMEVMETYPFTACTFEEVMQMAEAMLSQCESFSGCNAA